MDSTKNVARIKNFPLFSVAKEENLLSASLKYPPEILKLSVGEEYELENSIALLETGKTDLVKKIADKKVYLKTVDAPGVTGLATLFDKEKEYISTVVAKKDVEAILISEKFVEFLVLNDPNVALKLTKLLCSKVRYLNQRIDYYTCSGVENKLHEFLERTAVECEGEKSVEMSMSKLSDILGIGRASLYRALVTLEEEGTIIKKGKKIILIK